MHLLVQFDGGSRGNPGPAGCGVVVLVESSKEVVQELSVWLKEPKTGNQAEYHAALIGVLAAVQLDKKLRVERVTLQGDSSLIIQQLLGNWAVRSPVLGKLHARVSAVLTRAFAGRYTLCHFLREHNGAADALANKAMDRRQSTVATNTRLLERLAVTFGRAVRASETPSESDPAPARLPPRAEGKRPAAAAAPELAREGVACAPAGTLTLSRIRKLLKAELQEECGLRGLSKEGTAEELRARLRPLVTKSA